MDERIVHASRVVQAPAATIFELIADPARQPEWDGNDNLAIAAPGQRVHAVGDVFVMTISNGADRENHVVAFEEGRAIAWRPSEPGAAQPGHEWRWDVEDLGDGTTRVTHTYDWTDLHDEQRIPRAQATTSERLLASVERLAALAEAIGDADASAWTEGTSTGPTTLARIVVLVPADDADVVDVLVPELLGTAEGAELDLEVVVVPSSTVVADAANAHAADDERVDVAPVPVASIAATTLARALREAAPRADVVVTVGAHGRNDPAELPALLVRLDEGDVDVVVGRGLAQAAAPGYVAMRAPAAAAIASRVSGGVGRIPVVAASLGLAVAGVDVEDRDAGALDDVVDGWHEWHDRVVLGLLDRRVLRIVAAVGVVLLVAGVLLGLALIVPAILGLGVLHGAIAAAALVVVGVVVTATGLGLDAVRVAGRMRSRDS
ncbi:SRPBCC family protein [Agrococcus jejuensis]|uniref:Polyketide cyclase / dehydrase and lipid transport n=1 Tax=Agrococcus jejuensis TaxID=399736 RepID=A0A1G8G2W3_9MICO|nr:Polyketide cyclase / dehydrase and lipid transport [Agrococcus jejuensis]